jgi:hypothetical protein
VLWLLFLNKSHLIPVACASFLFLHLLDYWLNNNVSLSSCTSEIFGIFLSTRKIEMLHNKICFLLFSCCFMYPSLHFQVWSRKDVSIMQGFGQISRY